MPTVLVPLATGFEEIEAVTIIDVLRRAGIGVVVAGVGHRTIEGSHAIPVLCDCMIDECNASELDAVALPGGMPGTTNLMESEKVRKVVLEVQRSGGLVSAICAAPTLLNRLGLLEGKPATSHPAHRDEMDRCNYVEDRVVTEGNTVTSRGAGTALEFALELARLLAGDDVARDLQTKLVARD